MNNGDPVSIKAINNIIESIGINKISPQKDKNISINLIIYY
jgi:hypothetical protein